MTHPVSPDDQPVDTADNANASMDATDAAAASAAASAPTVDERLDDILDDMRTRYDETPQWEFCEGFMAALVCSRRPIEPDEWMSVLLDVKTATADGGGGSFADAAQCELFMSLWAQRQAEVKASLDAEVEALDDERAYSPLVLDIRAGVALLPEAERADIEAADIPSFAQVWALGFMFAVESWPDEWAAPRDKTAKEVLDNALDAIVAMTEDDLDVPTLNALDETGPPSVSAERLNAFGEALWAVYDLREMWRAIGPRVETRRAVSQPGRNDVCWCGSGKKYKRCHGAN
jgi:uncharacterized protein